ncbi:biotin transporter BioY [Alkalibacillus haloalkaliphilus]|uniref:biotin transporter BioY n=1 Tax=Alkalibacillus haloalkaliphilus TaxID=94136 RepID=UPI002936C7FB|nr:biotin transporter BioY [Alkalibacillus haloalkaliphilus]MDV2582114.1 biotin transporter BioY [Alkalibacillus haloalkaliphilus]
MKRKFSPSELTLGSVFVVLLMIGANIAIWFPFLKITYGAGSVPLSLQTFFAILAGIILGRKLGSFTVIVYLLIGAAGVPVFAEMSSGLQTFIYPTGGFLFSFIAVAWVTGYIVEKSQNPNIKIYLAATFAGLMANYLIGTPFMVASTNLVFEVPLTLTQGAIAMLPFFIKDFVITMGAAILLPKILGRLSVVNSSIPTHNTSQ